jgi:putative membrane protein
MKIDIKESFFIFIRGFLMGCADSIPGISGGTIALIVGIYNRLVHGIGKIKFGFVKPLLKGNFPEFKEKLIDEIDFQLFIPLLTGIALALISLSKLITYLMDKYPVYTFSFFLGLILASSYILYTSIFKVSLKIAIVSIIGFIFAYIFVGLNPISANHSLIVIFFSGVIAICAMILPGISGAFLLLLLGQYEYMLNALHTFNLPEIITFCVGALIGILSFSKFLDYLLKHHKEITMGFLIGLMIGTLRLPLDKILDGLNISIANGLNISQISIFPSILAIIMVLIGFIIIFIMEKHFDHVD